MQLGEEVAFQRHERVLHPERQREPPRELDFGRAAVPVRVGVHVVVGPRAANHAAVHAAADLDADTDIGAIQPARGLAHARDRVFRCFVDRPQRRLGRRQFRQLANLQLAVAPAHGPQIAGRQQPHVAQRRAIAELIADPVELRDADRIELLLSEPLVAQAGVRRCEYDAVRLLGDVQRQRAVGVVAEVRLAALVVVHHHVEVTVLDPLLEPRQIRTHPVRHELAFLRRAPEEQPVGGDEVTVDRDLERSAAHERRPGRRCDRAQAQAWRVPELDGAGHRRRQPRQRRVVLKGALFQYGTAHAMNLCSKSMGPSALAGRARRKTVRCA